ncbi:MAG: hypothetical protein H7242_10130, partial [Microbacteriaceae bacterium]|nr:hypothetical protein [Burkholderiaceae bacterium]
MDRRPPKTAPPAAWPRRAIRALLASLSLSLSLPVAAQVVPDTGRLIEDQEAVRRLPPVQRLALPAWAAP